MLSAFGLLVSCVGTKNESPVVDSIAVTDMQMVDPRDGQVYKTAKIGEQIWMAENLNYDIANSACYDNCLINCIEKGHLYTWSAAVEACPTGWHLPTQNDWNDLFTTLGGQASAAIALKSFEDWKTDEKRRVNATGSSGFSALYSGYRKFGDSFSMEGGTFFWVSDYYNDSLAYYMGLRSESDNAFLLAENKNNMYSVRCLKDNPSAKNEFIGKKTPPLGQKQNQFIDIRDGHAYKTVTYGKQTWMAEDLAFEAEFDDDCLRGYCQNAGLYTWKTAMGDAYTQENIKESLVQGICPIGWHLPDTTEWNTLISELGGGNAAIKILLSTTRNGFNMVLDEGTVLCNENSVETVCGGSSAFWSSVKSREDADYAHEMFIIDYSNGKMEIGIDQNPRRDDIPIRCVKDEDATSSDRNSDVEIAEKPSQSADSLSYGIQQVVTDIRDGQTYRTTKIGDQIWMAENLNFKTEGSFCYHDSTQYCEKLGRFYTWGAAMDSAGIFSANGKGCGDGETCLPTFPVRGVCPSGWHLPTLAEWNSLIETAGGGYYAASKLMSAKGWDDDFNWVDNGTDDFGFSAYPSCNMEASGKSGFCNPPVNYWSSIESNSNEAYHMRLNNSNHSNEKGVSMGTIDKQYAFTIRCVRD